MQIPGEVLLMWFASALYLVSIGFLIKKIQDDKLSILYPITAYLFGIAAFFAIMGMYMLNKNDLLVFIGSIFIMFGSTYTARLPLRIITPSKENIIFTGMLLVSMIIAAVQFTKGPAVLEKTAHTYAFLVAGLFTVGYMFYLGAKYEGIRNQSISTGASLGLCCVVAHGAAAGGYVSIMALSFFGILVQTPMVFALLSPFAFMYVVIAGKLLNPASILKKQKKLSAN